MLLVFRLFQHHVGQIKACNDKQSIDHRCFLAFVLCGKYVLIWKDYYIIPG